MPVWLDRSRRDRFRRLRAVLAILNSLGAGEAIAILVIALIVLGPEKLPDAIRKFGNIYGELRRMSHGFQSELRDAFDEPLRELRGTAQMMQDAVNEPAKAVTSELRAPVVGGGKKATETAAAATAGAAATANGSADETLAPVEESQAPVEETQAPIEETQAPAEEAETVVDADEDGVQSAEDGQPVLAQAGLMVSEPELAVPSSNGAGEEAPPAEDPPSADTPSAEDASAADAPRDG
jgi:sec-independent protein translocase protein TatB